MIEKLVKAMEKAKESNMELIDVFNEAAKEGREAGDLLVAAYYLGLALDVVYVAETIDNELQKLKAEES